MSKENLYCIILAGGQGTRLWPLSQQKMPKQFIDLIGVGQTMLQLTFNRFREICPIENFIIATNADYVDIVRSQLPGIPLENILAEPLRRNTAATIAFATEFIKQRNSQAVLLFTPADHLIFDPERKFLDSILSAVDFAENHDALMTIGVHASRPETAFGYIQVGEKVEDSNVNRVITFTEKPDAEMAQVFFDCGEFCWNTGIFVFNIQAIETAMNIHLPAVHKQFEILDSLPSSHWTQEALRQAFEECEFISIDHGVMEKAQNIYMVETNVMWSDLGSWEALFEIGNKDESNNTLLNGKTVMKNSKNCLVRLKDKKVALIDGLEDYLILEKGNYMIICPRSKANASWKYSSEMKVALDSQKK